MYICMYLCISQCMRVTLCTCLRPTLNNTSGSLYCNIYVRVHVCIIENKERRKYIGIISLGCMLCNMNNPKYLNTYFYGLNSFWLRERELLTQKLLYISYTNCAVTLTYLCKIRLGWQTQWWLIVSVRFERTEHEEERKK